MQDQAQALEQRGVAVTYLSSTLEQAEMRRRMARAAAGEFKLLYVAPERLTFPGFKALLADLDIPLVAVDEAHCISQWGHDFRPEYLQIGDLLADVRPPRMLACTATATPVVRDEIIARLGLGADTPQIVRGFARPNLDPARARDLAVRANAPPTWTRCCERRSAGRARPAAWPSSTRRRARRRAGGGRGSPRRGGGPSRITPGSNATCAPRPRRRSAAATSTSSPRPSRSGWGSTVRTSAPSCTSRRPAPSRRTTRKWVARAATASRPGGCCSCRRATWRFDGACSRAPRATTAETLEHKWNLFLELLRWAEGGSCRHDAILRYFGDEAETLAGCGTATCARRSANRPGRRPGRGGADRAQGAERRRPRSRPVRADGGGPAAEGRGGRAPPARRASTDDDVRRAARAREEWLMRLLRRW